jgi:hypothetical protein
MIPPVCSPSTAAEGAERYKNNVHLLFWKKITLAICCFYIFIKKTISSLGNASISHELFNNLTVLRVGKWHRVIAKKMFYPKEKKMF